MRTVDAHHHLWRRGDPGTEWLDGDGLEPLRKHFTVDDTRAVFDAHEVAGSVLVEARSTVAETASLLDTAEALASGRGAPHAVVGWIDLTGDVVAQVADLRTHPAGERLVGVRHQIQGEGDAWFATRAATQGIEDVFASGLVFDLVVRADQLDRVAELVACQRGGSFVLDHLGKPPIAAGFDAAGAWRRHVEHLAALPGLTAKLSGLVTEADWTDWTIEDIAPFVAHAVDCFGPERLLHGSDWPVCTLASDYERVVDLHQALVDATWHEAVFADNASRVYGLGVS